MKQVLQSLKTGATRPEDVPAPKVKPGYVLIRTERSVISAGTERMLLSFGQANLIAKARQHPAKVKMVLERVKTDGLVATMEAVNSKLEYPVALGYANAGVVLEVGAGVVGLKPGDRVASNGAHAEVVCVPKNLCAKIPDSVSAETAAFTVLGAIALQGVRLAMPTIGESFVVSGLGLIGLLTVQILRAQGCRVLGVDFDETRLARARQYGAETVHAGNEDVVLERAAAFSGEVGVDGVIIAAATSSSAPIQVAAKMCRRRGRIILTGVSGLELSRQDFFEKELTFQVSCSYGPGRYDPKYEEQGHDYPAGYVRWTEQRNFEAVLGLMAEQKIETESLISHRFSISDVTQGYEVLNADQPSLGVVLEYGAEDEASLCHRSVSLLSAVPAKRETPRLGIIGAGNYAGRVLIPAFKKTDCVLKAIVSAGGVSAVHFGKRFGFEKAVTDTEDVFQDVDINAVVIATRHDTHADLACQALRAGKHVFVEKPLALTHSDLDRIEDLSRNDLCLMVGFNRRFAPHVQKMKVLLRGVNAPKSCAITVNAGAVPAEHWVHDPQKGGGRILGEGCHFIDLVRYLIGCPVRKVWASMLSKDSAVIALDFEDGSIGTIHYLTNGHREYPKERVEVFCAEKVLVLDNFRVLRGYGWPNFKHMRLWKQDKGQKAMAAAFIACIRDGQEAPIPHQELFEVSRLAVDVAEELMG